jgi:hypothetical protein
MRCWLEAGVFEDIVADLRVVLCVAEGRDPEASAAIFDARTLQSTPESGARVGYVDDFLGELRLHPQRYA